MFYKVVGKRILDIIFSFFGLIILSPLLLILAILVRIKLGKPIIFKQKRIGRNNKEFTIFKFRSMNNKTDANGDLLLDCERMGKFGRILRATSLDELPELINVLIGDMSLIGPRPLPITYYPYFTDRELHRHDVRGGITGLAQVKGRNFITWEKRFEYDLQYIESISFAIDLKIFFETILKVAKHSDIGVRGESSPPDFHLYRKNKLR